MASYAKASALQSSKNQLPTMLVQAKPAVISSSGSGFSDDVTGVLSERMNSTLRFAPDTKQDLDISSCRFDCSDQRAVKHIEDDFILQKQNASNQMRQAAVMAAVASQQKVRLSAKERLALTAKRPTTTQQMNQQLAKQTSNSSISSQSTQQMDANFNKTSKQTSLPTLETLLAVQRQLQQHTKQNLNSLPQHVVTTQQPEINGFCENSSSVNVLHQSNKPLPPSPLRSPSPIKQVDPQDIETYDKDLPPLPESISPSTSTDDSQLNSLESHQSSPATSLVSIPPPPPPISSYLEQYDEVNNACHQSNYTASSSPSTISSISDVSSIRKFPSTLQIKPVSERHAPIKSASFELPLPIFEQSPRNEYENSTNSANARSSSPELIKPPAPQPAMQAIKKECPPIQQAPRYHHQLLSGQIDNLQSKNNNAMQQQLPATKPIPPIAQMMPTPPPPLIYKPEVGRNVSSNTYENQAQNLEYSMKLHKPQFDRNQHVFNSQPPQSLNNSDFLPPPPPPLTDAGFDEPDGGINRFSTPPPPELLPEEVDDGIENEDDFQCKIPTPPPHESISLAAFNSAELDCHKRGSQINAYKSASPLFNSSTFTANSASMVESLQPPPLFRQQQQQMQRHHQQHTSSVQTKATRPPQLTVRIGHNEGGGLLSTAAAINSNHHSLHHQNANHHIHHHNMMMAMTASSSSPSSSSDGDGHSTNSSSSTSGIHSSIDSPSSSSSKLVDDFNYTCKTKKPTLNHLSYKQSFQKRGITSSSSLKQSSVPASIGANLTTAQATAIRPALKQKKTVSFSDKVELVACADEQSEDHLPNPLLARVLAGKLQ